MNHRKPRFLTTPRLLVVGLFVLAAGCHRRHPANVPTPTAPPTPVTPPPAAPTTVAIGDAPSLLHAMHDRYAPTWYHSVAFTEKTTLGLPSGGNIVQTWHEAIEPPGRARIDTDVGAGAGVLFVHDSIYNFNGGKLTHAEAGSNELLVLVADVYAQPVTRTEAALRSLGFDLHTFHAGTWHGMQVYVVGANRGDTTSKQFWVDRDRLLVVRILEKTAQGLTDTRYDAYVAAGGGRVPTDVSQHVNGKLRIREQSSKIEVDAPLPAGAFDPRRWADGLSKR